MAIVTLVSINAQTVTSITGTPNRVTVSSPTGAVVVDLAPNVALPNPTIGLGYLSLLRNTGTGGVRANNVVSLDASGNVILASSTDGTIAGIATSTVGVGTRVEVAIIGTAQCVSDNFAYAGNLAVVSATTRGFCSDSGQSQMAGIRLTTPVVGRILASVPQGQAVSLSLFGPGTTGQDITNVSTSTVLPAITAARVGLPITTDSITGVITQDTRFARAQRFIHTYVGAGGDGANTFVGLYSGNFTMGPNGGPRYFGSYNTGVGYDTLKANTTGAANVALGMDTLYQNTTGSNNTGLGMDALPSNTIGSSNTAVGYNASFANTVGDWNVAVGANALYWAGNGSGNVAVGNAALYLNTASFNTAVGHLAMYSNSSGRLNTAIGQASLYSNTTGLANVAVGSSALQRTLTGSFNTAMGVEALLSNTSGNYNTAVGQNALRNNTTASNNTAVGYLALYNNTTGYLNAGLGHAALYSNTTGAYNVALGPSSLGSNTTGYYNVGLGEGALSDTTSGYANTSVGQASLKGNTTGYANVAVGQLAGYTATPSNANTVGSENVWIGYNSGPNDPGPITNSVAIGSQARSTRSNQAVLGNSRTTETLLFGRLGIGVGAPLVGGTGTLHATGNTARPLDTPRTITNSTTPCNPGEIAFDATYLYVCPTNSNWRRIPLGTAF